MATVYVSTTGSDAYTYVQAQSSSTPWATVGKCETSATSGDTIICLSGTHTWAAVAFTKSFTITTQGGLVYFNGGGSGGKRWTVAAGKTLTLSNLVFYNAVDTSGQATGISIVGNGGSIIATNCIFHTITGSSGNSGNAECLSTYQAISSVNITATSCVFYGLKALGGTTYGAIGGRIVGTGTCTITNCVFYSNETSPVTALVYFVAPTSLTLTVKNCIFADEKLASLDAISGGTVNNISYSDFYGTTNEGGTGSITSDPLFVDAPNANFNLRPSSPCIDTGTTS